MASILAAASCALVKQLHVLLFLLPPKEGQQKKRAKQTRRTRRPLKATKEERIGNSRKNNEKKQQRQRICQKREEEEEVGSFWEKDFFWFRNFFLGKIAGEREDEKDFFLGWGRGGEGEGREKVGGGVQQIYFFSG